MPPTRRPTARFAGAAGVLLLALLVAGWSAEIGGRAAEPPGDPSSPAWVAPWEAEDRRIVAVKSTDPPPDRVEQPYRVTPDLPDESTVVLPLREAPYRLSEIRERFPEAVLVVEPGVWLLTEHLLLRPGAMLVQAAPEVRELRLLSDPERFVSVVGWRAEIDVAGDQAGRLRVVSWDPATGGPDRTADDGRAYLQVRGGRMDVQRAELAYLGFGTGLTSGVAWKGWPGEPSTGNVGDSRFHHNHFGAYTFEAVEMRWVGNVFADNAVYGFDPHDHSDRFVVEFNVAARNGRHGIIFSRGCRGNVIRFNLAYGNGWHGIVLDDGRIAEDGNPNHLYADPSSDNLVEFNAAWDNEVGIALEGGTGNVVRANYVGGNRYGLRLKDEASDNAIEGNAIVGNEEFGLFAYAGSGGNRIAGNRIVGGRAGVVVRDATGNRILDNAIAAVAGHAVALVGEADGTAIAGNVLAGRGSSAIDTRRAPGVAPDAFAENDLDGWIAPGYERGVVATTIGFFRYHPALAPWLAIFLPPAFNSLRRRRPAVRSLCARSASSAISPARTEERR